MAKWRASAGIGGAGLALLLLAPAIAATSSVEKQRDRRPSLSLRSGGFTPAVADPRLAAEFARRGLSAGSFRFTPSVSADKSKPVTVAVRASALTPQQAQRSADATSASAVTPITPTAYSLGVSIGWKRFALSGDVEKFDGGALPGRESAEVGVSYRAKKFTGRVAVGAERNDAALPRLVAVDSAYSLDVGGSYSIARNLDVTGGVRYKIQRDRLEPLTDDRRDSQAVYIGTAFRF